jgi:colicin import membrane protein
VATLALEPSPWQPQRPGGMGLGATLAVVAHAVLIAGLALGVAWRSSPSEVVMSAELWSNVPQVAAPAPQEPPPSPKPKPVEPQIGRAHV